MLGTWDEKGNLRKKKKSHPGIQDQTVRLRECLRAVTLTSAQEKEHLSGRHCDIIAACVLAFTTKVF